MFVETEKIEGQENCNNEDSYIFLMVIRMKHAKINYVSRLCQYVTHSKIVNIIKKCIG